jgi:hypothetical protein
MFLQKILNIVRLLVVFILVLPGTASSQNDSSARFIAHEIEWNEIQQEYQTGFPEYFPLTFPDAQFSGEEQRFPVLFLRIPIDFTGDLTWDLVPTTERSTQINAEEWTSLFEQDYPVDIRVSLAGEAAYALIDLVPLRTVDGQINLLTGFRLTLRTHKAEDWQHRNREYAVISELNEGTFYKIAIEKTGIYRLDRDYLTAQGIDPSGIDPNRIQLFGNYGSPLPESLEISRIDDLRENPMYFSGDNDSAFEEGEFFLFYAEGPDTWKYNVETGRYDYTQNVYDVQNYCFLKTDGPDGFRMATRETLSNPGYLTREADHPQVYESDRTNLLAQYDHTEGTGQDWYGESFFSTKEQDFSGYFDFSDQLVDREVQFFVRFAARHGSQSVLGLEINENRYTQIINGVSIQSPEATYARNGIIEGSFVPGKPIDRVVVTTNAYQGWLDRIEINVRKPLVLENKPLFFSDRFSVSQAETGYELTAESGDFLIWDITDPLEPVVQQYVPSSNQRFTFSHASGEVARFAAFHPGDVKTYPGRAVRTPNQNLHGIFEADMVIVYHEDFREAAEMLADHRRMHNGFNVLTADIEQIYNEFSSGKQDPTAVRDLAKMIYDRDPDFRYLLLFGDGSYDYRGILLNDENNDNYVPVYETRESLNPISGYVSDDYFALLSDNEGNELSGDLDIAVGRLPVSTREQANLLVEKIIAYETSPGNNGDWQNRLALIADDEDYSRHLDQSETVASYLREEHPVFNVEKIYLDAFQQEVNPGGARYPEVNKTINDQIFKGVLAMTYIGHGGPGGFAQERILKLEDIYGWNNENKLPLLITATCSFAGFDDPSINTAGEASILKENGGVIALFSTVRLVYSNENSKLINSVYEELFSKYDGEYQKLGDILKHAKNKIGNKDNKRKFFLFGDPAMQLALPKHQVYTSRINGIDVRTQAFPDTLRALNKVRVEGFIGDENGNLQSNFNGIIYPTVFDKERLIKTLGNDPNSPIREFELQKQVLFKGSASVVNGEFSFEFIIPKDIDYRYGEGKISYYYDNLDNIDATGYFDAFTIGGSTDEELTDQEGPQITLYLNHTGFRSGDVTSNRPVLLAFLNDETGINISGTSIGHDPGAILDGDQQQYFRLNDFFESSVDDYSSGMIEFPLDRLDPGLHTLYVEAWDLLNNKGEASIEFIVANEEEQVLSGIFNYPNPLSDRTFFHFEHTLPDTDLDVTLFIYDIGGRLVKTLRANAFTDGHQVSGIRWEGNAENGQKLPNGVYYYTIEVDSSVLGVSVSSAFEKLVIIK